MPSVLGSEILVNSTRSGKQYQAASATSSNGSSVIVWTEMKSSLNGDIKAQRFDANGNKVGGEIGVATGFSPQHDPVVAMDSRGNFAVAWVHDISTTDRDIRAARFNSSGVRQGSEIVVANTPRHEYDPAIAMAGNGNFIITHTYQFSNSDGDIKAKLYSANGAVTKSFTVDASSRSEGSSAVAMAADGRFAVAYVKSDDIIVKRYNQYGNTVGTHTVANSTRQEREPSVAMDSKGNAIVVWQVNVNNNWNVQGRSVFSNGSLGGTFTVAGTSAQEFNPAVAYHPTNGKFAVAYQTQTTGNPSVKVTEYAASKSVIRTSTALTNVADPFISLGASSGRYLAVANSVISKGGDSDGGIFARFGVL
jgi:hypothetical protein